MSRRSAIRARILMNVKIDKETGCWVWQGGNSGHGRGGGYGRVSLDGSMMAVHRIMYTNEHGIIPHKKQIDHICKNRICCNPDHLELVTHKQNCKRRDGKNG